MTSSLSNEDINAYSPVQRLLDGRCNVTLVYVDLANNGIKTNGDTCISDFLRRNPSLKSLIFKGNQINDNDALAIAQALQSNSNLRLLDLDNNALTKEGKAAAFLLAIFGITSSAYSLNTVKQANLNKVSGANHTCGIRGIADGLKRTPISSLRNLWNCNNKSVKSNRGKKLFELFLRRHHTCGNISHLETYISEDCMRLEPRVLGCINTCSTYSTHSTTACLSVLFEVVQDLRIWDLRSPAAPAGRGRRMHLRFHQQRR